jgi:replication-associated recombination protein RarA
MSDYDIGFKKPPKHTQFQKGQSGNPKGRPKGVKNIATDIKEELEEFVQIHEGQQVKTVTKQRALIKALLAKASKGDVRAAQTLLSLKAGVDQSDQEKDIQTWFTDDDLEIIDHMKQRLLSSTDTPEEDTDESQ